MPLTPWKKLSEKVLASGWGREFREAQFTTHDGKDTSYFYVHAPDAVMIVAVADDGTIPLVKQWRPILGKVMTEFPAGTRDGDDATEDAKRELAEEVKVQAAHMEWVGRQESSAGLTTVAMDVYVAWGLTPIEAEQDDTEEFEHLSMTSREIDAAIANHEITAGMVISAWHQARPRVLEVIDQLGAKR
mgnify:FL=1